MEIKPNFSSNSHFLYHQSEARKSCKPSDLIQSSASPTVGYFQVTFGKRLISHWFSSCSLWFTYFLMVTVIALIHWMYFLLYYAIVNQREQLLNQWGSTSYWKLPPMESQQRKNKIDLPHRISYQPAVSYMDRITCCTHEYLPCKCHLAEKMGDIKFDK